MDKNRLCYVLRSRYPEAFGIRKFLQRGKVKRIERHLLSGQEIAECERDASKKEDIIAPYLSKWEKYLKPVVEEMEDILKNAPLYKDRKDKDRLRADMMYCRLAYGFIPSEYTVFELENRSPQERREFISDTDTNIFGYSVNNIAKLQSILDKGEMYKRFSEYFKREAIVIEYPSDYEAFYKFVQAHPVFVKKKVFSSMGKGTECVDFSKNKGMESECFKKLIASGKYLLEELVIQHGEMAKFHPFSVNTIRCITLRTNKGIEIPYCFMKTGQNGSFVDNAGKGGICIGIDAATGTLNTDGFDEYGSRYATHPNSGLAFKGNKIPAWDELTTLCKRAAEEVDDIAYLSWDLAYTDNGWVVIEVNEVGQLIGPQMTMQRGIKAELDAYFTRMKKVI